MNDGNTPLHYAVQGANLGNYKFLIWTGANASTKNIIGKAVVNLARESNFTNAALTHDYLLQLDD